MPAVPTRAWSRRADADLDPTEPDDRGVVTAFVVVFTMALLFVTGLALDGGRILNTHLENRNLARAAARAGAQVLDEQSIRDGSPRLDPAGAESAACDFLRRAGHPCGSGGTVDVQGNLVTVTVSERVGLIMIPGVAPQTVVVEGRACNARGITGNEATARC